MSNSIYVGVAPLTMIRTKSGGYLNVYAGGVVPDDITDEDLKRLLDEGFLGVLEIPDEVPEVVESKSAAKKAAAASPKE